MGQSTSWPSGAKVLSQKTNDSIETAVAIPLSQLTKSGVQPGQSLYANFFRARSNGDALSWSATFSPSFHDLEHLGKLTLE
jgi:hypothetical protein